MWRVGFSADFPSPRAGHEPRSPNLVGGGPVELDALAVIGDNVHAAMRRDRQRLGRPVGVDEQGPAVGREAGAGPFGLNAKPREREGRAVRVDAADVIVVVGVVVHALRQSAFFGHGRDKPWHDACALFV